MFLITLELVIEKAEFSQRVRDAQIAEVNRVLKVDLAEENEVSTRLECKACDELPLIGPSHGGSRILLGTGYGLHGIGLGFMAGKCLAELIHFGKSDALPRICWPERLRSWEIDEY